MPVIRVAVTPRYAVTHELTPDGLRIVPDQVITKDVDGHALEPSFHAPLGEIVTADTVAWDVPDGMEAEFAAQQGIEPPPAAAPTAAPASTSSSTYSPPPPPPASAPIEE